ncbi:MAG: metallophosphoesterase family protein [Bryobacterales bacterium]|nr:metallophosphoesterase family protein [Bryobacterales bacterium]
MRFLIISDLHANWEALQAVLEDAEGRYDRILCAGDLVDYGADPNAVVDWARRTAPLLVRGNHDKVCAGLEDMEWFNPAARISAAWTLETLWPANLEYLRSLPKGPLPVHGFQILHGSPLDEDEYLINVHDARQVLPFLHCSLSFFGHTHLQGGFISHDGGFEPVPAVPASQDERVLEIPGGRQCLINPGSVGQPRDGDPRAAYVLYSEEERLLRYRRVPYDVAAAQRKIRAAGLPARLANRLAQGE